MFCIMLGTEECTQQQLQDQAVNLTRPLILGTILAWGIGRPIYYAEPYIPMRQTLVLTKQRNELLCQVPLNKGKLFP
jgi:hypothetical protein